MDHTPRILIVEDDAVLVLDLENALTQMGYQVIGLVSTGKEAVEQALRLIPDLILMDIRLGDEVTGIQAAEEIHRCQEIPVIFLTAYTDEGLLQQAKGVHACAYLTKPVREYELRSSLEVVIHNHIAEKERRSIEAKFKAVVENNNDGIILMSADRKLLYVSPSYFKISGYAPEEPIGLYGSDFIHPEDRLRAAAAFSEVIQEAGNVAWAEYRIRHKNGHYFWVETTAKNLLDDPDIRAVVLNSRDITERKNNERILHQSEERYRQLAEKLTKTVSQLHALSNHLQTIREEERAAIAREIHDELGQRLTGLKMELFLLKKQARLNAPDYARSASERLGGALEQIDETIHQVRAIASNLRPSALDSLGLAPALEWLCQDFQSRYGVKCSFHPYHKQEHFDRQLATAAFRICQEALTNVLRHAEASEIEVHLNVEDDAVLLEIHDNGRGITEEEILSPRAFGLLGMRERALALGGAVSFIRRPAGGTSVLARLPQTLFAAGTVFSPSLAKRYNQLRILIVDDHGVVRKGISHILQADFPSVEIGEAQSAQEALRIAKRQDWDLMLVDINLPDANGLELVAELHYQYPALPILVMTVYPEEQFALRAIRAGAAGYLNKQSASEEVVHAVRKLMSGGKFISESVAEIIASNLNAPRTASIQEILSDREYEIFLLTAAGSSLTVIAQKLSLSVKTVGTYRSRLMKKMGFKNNTELISFAVQNHLIE